MTRDKAALRVVRSPYESFQNGVGDHDASIHVQLIPSFLVVLVCDDDVALVAIRQAFEVEIVAFAAQDLIVEPSTRSSK